MPRRQVIQKESPAAPAELLHLDQQLCFPLYAAGNLLTRLYRPLLQPLGLTYPQYLVMLVLWEQQPCSVNALGARLLLDSGTLTPLLKRMEAAGLVTRQRDAADERRVLVGLTTAGLALREAAQAVPQTLACRVLGNAADPEGLQHLAHLRDQLQGLVRTLNRSLDNTPAAEGASA